MKILLLGASGLLGGVLYQYLSRHHHVTGTSTRPLNGLHQLDLTDPDQVATVAADSYDVIVHCAGIVDLHRAEQEPDLTTRVHVTATRQLAAATHAKIVYFSTDNVFPGSAPRYLEHDQVGPRSVYGHTKLAAEHIVLQHMQNLVIRVPLLFGYSPWSTKFIDRFQRPQTPAVTDIVTNPVYLSDIAEYLPHLWNMSGIVHFGGAEPVSRFEFMDTARRQLGLPTHVVAIRNRDIDPDGLRPPRLVLESCRHTLTGRPLNEALKDMTAHG